MATTKSKAPAKGGKQKNLILQLVFRLLVLTAVASVIIAIGVYKYDWKPLGPKERRQTTKLGKPEVKLPQSLKAVADKLKGEIGSALPQNEAAPTPTLDQVISKAVETKPEEAKKAKATPTPKPAATPKPTPKPTPAPTPTPTPVPKKEEKKKKKTDKEALEEFLADELE